MTETWGGGGGGDCRRHKTCRGYGGNNAPPEHWASIPKVVGSTPTVARHIFQACPVWIHTRSNTTIHKQKHYIRLSFYISLNLQICISLYLQICIFTTVFQFLVSVSKQCDVSTMTLEIPAIDSKGKSAPIRVILTSSGYGSYSLASYWAWHACYIFQNES